MANSGAAQPTIGVLVVDDGLETRETLRKLLSAQPGIGVVGTASTGEQAIQNTQALNPDVVLMDLRMPGIDGVSATEAILRQNPEVRVIMMSVQSDAEALRRSMLAGVREYLTKPFTVEALLGTIRRVSELGPKRKADNGGVLTGKMGKIISVYSPKGGTGRSLIAVNLAILLHQEWGRKVALVDGSLQFGDVGVLLNLKPTRTIADIVPKIAEIDNELMRGVLLPHSSGIKALLSPGRPELADLIAPDHMRAVLRQLSLLFDAVVVDTWCSLHDLVLGIMDVSDRVVVVTTPEIPAIKSTRLFFEVADALSYPGEKTMLVVNRANQSEAISVEDIETSIRHRVAIRLPCDDRAATQAANVGVPLVLTNRRSGLTKAISELASQVNTQVLVSRTAAARNEEEATGTLG